MKHFFKYIKAASFIPEFTTLTYDSKFRHKMRGIDGNKQPIDFTEQEKEAIKKGFQKFITKTKNKFG